MSGALKKRGTVAVVFILLGLIVIVLLYHGGFQQAGSAISEKAKQGKSYGSLVVQYVLGESDDPLTNNVESSGKAEISSSSQASDIIESGMHSLEEPYALLVDQKNVTRHLQEVRTEPLPTFVPSKELFVRSVYFDDRPRNGHKNSSVFLVVAIRNITDRNLIIGCQVGRVKAKSFDVTLIGETPLWRAFYNFINHEEVIVNCYDLPIQNESDAYISYKGVKDNEIHIAASERPLIIPTPHLPPVSAESKKYNFTVITCAKIFSSPPWLEKWLTYQKTLGVDHVHLDAEDSFQKRGEMRNPYIVEAMESGFLSINIWVQWLNGKEIWYHNQGLIYEDCAYRFRGTYDYIVLLDTDDFFTPRVSGENKIHYYIDKYCSAPTIGSCKFKWIEYFPDHYGLTDASDADGNVTRRLGNYSHYIQGNPKSLHKTQAVVDVATHYAFKMMGGYAIERVSQGIAYVAHVRKQKHPPEKGLRLGLPSSSALHEHVLQKVLLFIILICCMFLNSA